MDELPVSRREEFWTWCWAFLTVGLRRTKVDLDGDVTILWCRNWKHEVVVLRIFVKDKES